MKSVRRRLKIIITAGPTREYIDPVRFISNAATGTIGYALAREAKINGHQVMLVSGPSHLKPASGVLFRPVVSAAEMQEEVKKHFSWADVFIASAAVCDYSPVSLSEHKIKKSADFVTLKLKKTSDILAQAGRNKRGKLLVGFALETEDLIKNAKAKLRGKKLDLIVANELSPGNDPFGSGRFRVYIISRKKTVTYSNISKKRLSRIILDSVEKLCYSFSNKKKRR